MSDKYVNTSLFKNGTARTGGLVGGITSLG